MKNYLYIFFIFQRSLDGYLLADIEVFPHPHTFISDSFCIHSCFWSFGNDIGWKTFHRKNFEIIL